MVYTPASTPLLCFIHPSSKIQKSFVRRHHKNKNQIRSKQNPITRVSCHCYLYYCYYYYSPICLVQSAPATGTPVSLKRRWSRMWWPFFGLPGRLGRLGLLWLWGRGSLQILVCGWLSLSRSRSLQAFVGLGGYVSCECLRVEGIHWRRLTHEDYVIGFSAGLDSVECYEAIFSFAEEVAALFQVAD